MAKDPRDHVIDSAHFLLCFNYQSYAENNGVAARGYWLVSDLDPKARDMMNSAEVELYDALLKAPI